MKPFPFSPVARRQRARAGGFSLVEVTIAIAVVVVSLLPILAMLPAGLNNYKNSVARTKATHLMSEIATCIQLATPPSPTAVAPASTTQYTALAPFNSAASGALAIAWTPQPTVGAIQKFGPIFFDENGTPVGTAAAPSTARMVAMITLIPPGTSFAPGTAYIYVGWPALGAAPTWSSGNLVSFPGAQGHEEITIPINPSSP